jgi:hypothetical protein
MRRIPLLIVASLLTLLMLAPSAATAQTQWIVGGRLGLSLYTVGGGSPIYNYYYGVYSAAASSTQAGLQIGPTAEVIFNKQFAICTDLNINTQAGTPIEWANTFKIYFPVAGSKIRPYADAGFNLWFYTGGPYFGIRGGGGALFPIAPHLYIPADLQIGPVFATGITPFYIAITSGIRYEI